MDQKRLTHLRQLEAESIHIIREVAAEFSNPVMMYSIGKDSSVMLHLARKAFYPGTLPFPLLHVDTGWKFREMYEFRDRTAKAYGCELLVHKNPEGVAYLLFPRPLPPLGPEKPASGAVAQLQRPDQQGRKYSRLPALQLDRAGYLAVHLSGKY